MPGLLLPAAVASQSVAVVYKPSPEASEIIKNTHRLIRFQKNSVSRVSPSYSSTQPLNKFIQYKPSGAEDRAVFRIMTDALSSLADEHEASLKKNRYLEAQANEVWLAVY